MPTADYIYIETLRRLTPAQKLATIEGLLRTAWDLKAAWIRRNEPQLSEERVQQRVREAFRHGED